MVALASILILAALAAESGVERPADTSRLGLVAFQRIRIPDDVPAHLTTALAEDRDGFLWIGTQGGLVRYDGYEFKTFKPAPDDPGSLGGSYVRAVLATRDGRIWVGSFADGVSVYDPKRESFDRYRHDPSNPTSLSHDRVEALAEDADGGIWVATFAGLDRIDPRSGVVERVRLPEGASGDPSSGLVDERLRALLIDRAGRLWVGGRGGLLRLRAGPGPRVFETVPLGAVQRPFVSRLFEDRLGRLVVGTADQGAAVRDPDGAVRFLRPQPGQPDGLSHFYVYGITEGPDGEIWVATFGGGVDIIDEKTLRVVDRLRHDPAVSTTIPGDRVGGLLRDRAGLMWVGSWGQGVARHDPSSRAFGALRYGPGRAEGLSHPAAVRALGMRDGTLWVGTNGNGIDVFDWNRGRIGAHRPASSDQGALADGSITCLAQSANGAAWVATLDGTLHVRQPGRSRFERIGAGSGLPGGPIRSLAFGPDGAVWAGSNEGLARIDPASLKVVTYRHDPKDEGTLSGHEVEALALGGDGTLWVGTGNGLNALDPVTGRVVRITREAGRPSGLPNNWVPDLMVASDGRLWVATQGGAVILKSWDGRTATFEDVASRLGRAPEPVDALIEDEEGYVWLGPRLRVDPRAMKAREFSRADGLDFRTFFIASRSRTSRGHLLFGSPEGLAIVRPRLVRDWTYEPPLLVTDVRVEGRRRPGASQADNLALSERERGFQMTFASLDLSAPERTRYRFRLEGFDPDWSAADASRRTITYTNLPPGSYRLRAQGSNRAGVFSSRERVVDISVAPAFHQTRAFRGIALVAGVFLFYLVHRLRVRRLQARGRELEALVQSRTSELQAAYARIEEASLTDPLTGLRNRRFLEKSIQSDLDVVARAHADGHTMGAGGDLVFLLIDIDHFKKVNDTHGHGAGDAVLRRAATLLSEQTRSSDYVVRWGGEEFLVVARFVPRDEGPTLAEKIRAAFAARPFPIGGDLSLALTCSVGFAAYPFSRRHPRAINWETVLEVADRGLYAAKSGGRNRCVGFDASDSEDPQRLVEAQALGGDTSGLRRLGA